MEHKKVIIVDKDDQIIGYKKFDEIDFSSEIYRVSKLWLEDSKGNALLQKRSDKVKFYKNMWSFAAGGINDEGDTYESAVIREAKEEINIEIFKPEFLGKIFSSNSDSNNFRSYFRHVLAEEKPEINFDAHEVAGVKWFSKEEIKKELADNPQDFVPDTFESLEKFSLL